MKKIKKENFKESVIIKVVISIVLMMLGLLAIVGSMSTKMPTEHVQGFYLGTGCGVVVASLITLIKHIMLLKNEEKFEKAEIEYCDERNKFIKEKTFSISAFISIFLLYIAVLITAFIDFVIFKTILTILFIYFFILIVVYNVVKSTN